MHHYLVVTGCIVVVGGLVTWAIGRQAYVVGASGVLFGWWGLHVTLLLWERPVQGRSVLAAGGTGLLYGGWLTAAVPTTQGLALAWEAHLGGLLAGCLAAYLCTRYPTQPPPPAPPAALHRDTAVPLLTLGDGQGDQDGPHW